jgi:hypothetical protein
MPEISMRGGLKKIGEPKLGKASPAFPSGFCSAPRSLRQAVRSMDAPGPQDWAQVSDIFRDDSWTDEVQGVAWDESVKMSSRVKQTMAALT